MTVFQNVCSLPAPSPHLGLSHKGLSLKGLVDLLDLVLIEVCETLGLGSLGVFNFET